jgi:hypothetical protein
MERILSREDCKLVLNSIKDSKWERVDRYGKYDQTFISIPSVENKIKNYFDKEVKENPIIKILRFNKGDYIPTFSADYSNMEDEYFKRYKNTNFIIQIYLSDNFEGGRLTFKRETFDNPIPGFGIIQNKTDKCSISEVTENSCYMLFMFISYIKLTSVL